MRFNTCQHGSTGLLQKFNRLNFFQGVIDAPAAGETFHPLPSEFGRILEQQRETPLDATAARKRGDVLEVGEHAENFRHDERRLRFGKPLADSAAFGCNVVCVGGVGLVYGDGPDARLRKSACDVLLRVLVDAPQAQRLIQIPEDLGGFFPAPETRGKVGNRLRCDKKPDLCAAALVEQLDKGIVDDFCCFVDEDVHSSCTAALEVVSGAGGGGEVRKHEGSDGGADHAVGEGIEAEINDGVLIDEGSGVEKLFAQILEFVFGRGEHLAELAGSELHQRRKERRDHLAEMLFIVIAQ